jgi:hypothetical protein
MPTDYRFEDLDLREELPQARDSDSAIPLTQQYCSRTVCDSAQLCCA